MGICDGEGYLCLVERQERNVGIAVGLHIRDGAHEGQDLMFVNEACDRSHNKPKVRGVRWGIASLGVAENFLDVARHREGSPRFERASCCLFVVFGVSTKGFLEKGLVLSRLWYFAVVLRAPLLESLDQQHDEWDMGLLLRVQLFNFDRFCELGQLGPGLMEAQVFYHVVGF